MLLGESDKWKDLSFPCSEVSVVPAKEWFKQGMPPGNFIRWRRKGNIGVGIGAEYLFTHSVSFFKTVDRRLNYRGDGVIGSGFLKQGLLADRWFLNALAVMIARPDTLTSLFATTGQEEQGRYCTRFYEGGGWRSTYVDDRVPCSIAGILYTIYYILYIIYYILYTIYYILYL